MAAVKMGVDIVEPLAAAQGNYKYAVLTVKYFTE
jgi:hypothetical protein